MIRLQHQKDIKQIQPHATIFDCSWARIRYLIEVQQEANVEPETNRIETAIIVLRYNDIDCM